MSAKGILIVINIPINPPLNNQSCYNKNSQYAVRNVDSCIALLSNGISVWIRSAIEHIERHSKKGDCQYRIQHEEHEVCDIVNSTGLSDEFLALDLPAYQQGQAYLNKNKQEA